MRAEELNRNGELTQNDIENWMLSFIEEDSDEILTESLRDFLESNDSTHIFVEKVESRLWKLGYTLSPDSSEETAKILESLCEEAGVPLSSARIKKWLKEGILPDRRSRDAVYQLCFALKMDADQTAEFLLKAYMYRPFNYKLAEEATYFFCLNTGRTYANAIQIIEKYKSLLNNTNSGTVNKTVLLKESLDDISSDDEMIAFLLSNTYEVERQNQTAQRVYEYLKNSCQELAAWEMSESWTGPADKMSMDTLLGQIYGYDERAHSRERAKTNADRTKKEFEKWLQSKQFSREDSKYKTKKLDDNLTRLKELGITKRRIFLINKPKTIEKIVSEIKTNSHLISNADSMDDQLLGALEDYCEFLKEKQIVGDGDESTQKKFARIVGRNFPHQEQLKVINHPDKEDPGVMYDTMRKMLILLTFYQFHVNRFKANFEADLKEDSRREEPVDVRARAFVDAVDDILTQCGYGEIYIRNPFDRMICACAQTEQPLETLHSIIRVYYLHQEEIEY